MEWTPTPRTEVTHVVVPAASARLTQPAMLTPRPGRSLSLWGWGPTPLTTAVKVTDWPKTDGFTEDVTVVVDGAAASAVTIPRARMMTLSAQRLREPPRSRAGKSQWHNWITRPHATSAFLINPWVC